ncbi:serine hydrolase [Microlunatus speluncae]|uniref:serine hydrolase n=1 Tax=Microlunatus speluncae TaxID=2594267 RepID=UPI00126649F4|nr:serine hydrolase [Microlunatus speluncae]
MTESDTDDVSGSTAGLHDAARDVERDWRRTGLGGGFWARDLGTGHELGFGPDRLFPLASVIKLPLALVAFDEIVTGRLDPAEPIDLDPATATAGPSGISLFRHPARIAVGDLIMQSLSVSDNAAADALFDRLPPELITRRLREWGCAGITVRHPIRELNQALAELVGDDRQLALELTVRANTRGGGHAVAQLDPHRANAGSARALIDLLERIWADSVATPGATALLREALSHQLRQHRLAADLISDLTSVRSKTGTLLNLRHEVGVVETGAGERLAVAALTSSSIPAFEQPEAEWAIAQAARTAVDALLAER